MTRKPNSGLSQLELMIALAIMGMIAILLANTMNFSRISLDRTRLFSDQTQSLFSRERLRNWIEDMPLAFGEETALDFFNGSQNQLEFKSLISDGTFWFGEPVTVFLALNDSSDAVQVFGIGLDWENHDTKEERLKLAKNARGIKITYFGRKSGEAEKSWHTKWSDGKFLPDLVKIEWELEDGSYAPPLTLQPGKKQRHKLMSLSSLVPPL